MELIATILLLIIALQIFMLVADRRVLEVVRAGKVNKDTARYRIQQLKSSPKTAGLKAYAVSGESMRDYDIHDGDTVYVRVLKDEEKNAIDTYPVLMFDIENMGCLESRYKLRKFVGFVESLQHCDWESFYEEHRERLHEKIGKEAFCEMCREKVEKLTGVEDSAAHAVPAGRYILSETHEEKYQFSLHPAKTVYGKVCYAA